MFHPFQPFKKKSCLLTTLLLVTVSAEAQQPGKVAQIGYLTGTSLSAIAHRVEAFRQGLRELGYIERKNVVIEYRSAEGKSDRLSELAGELIRLKVDVIVTTGASVTRSAKQTTDSIPIVMTQANDPVGSGFVASLARPGGNVTGLSSSGPEVSGKRLEILKEILPKLSRVAVLTTSTDPANPQDLKETELAAKALGVNLQSIDVVDAKSIDAAFREVTKLRADALLMMMAGPVANPHRKKIADLAVKSRLPAIYTLADYVEAGGLMAYGLPIHHQQQCFLLQLFTVDHVISNQLFRQAPIKTHVHCREAKRELVYGRTIEEGS